MGECLECGYKGTINKDNGICMHCLRIGRMDMMSSEKTAQYEKGRCSQCYLVRDINKTFGLCKQCEKDQMDLNTKKKCVKCQTNIVEKEGGTCEKCQLRPESMFRK